MQNTGRMPLGPTLLEDQTPASLHGGATAPLHGLSPGQGVPLSYRAIGRQRGRHRFGPLSVRLTDPLSITTRRVEVAGTSEVLVLPRMVALPAGVRAASGRVPGDSGGGVPQPIGDDVGVIREYQVGDDLRRIHWPATAHRGELMVRQSESRRHDRVVILLDRSPGSDLELRIECAASIGATFHDQGAEVQLVDDPHDLQVSTMPWEVATRTPGQPRTGTSRPHGPDGDPGRGFGGWRHVGRRRAPPPSGCRCCCSDSAARSTAASRS